MARLKIEKQRNLVIRLNEMKKSRIAIFKRSFKQHENILNNLSNFISPNSNKNIINKPDEFNFLHNTDFTSIEKKIYDDLKDSKCSIKRRNKNKKSIINDNEVNLNTNNNNIKNNHNNKNILIKENTKIFSNIFEMKDKYKFKEKEKDKDKDNIKEIIDKGIKNNKLFF